MSNEITQEILRELLDYNVETGELRWREREIHWFADSEKQSAFQSCRAFNGQFAGKLVTSHRPDGYLQIGILGEYYRAHRVIWKWMTGAWPDHVDHINGIRDDNRWENLRSVSASENHRNRGTPRGNTSGFVGVFWNKQKRKWASTICVNGKRTRLGFFDAPEDAHAAYQHAASQLGFSDRHVHAAQRRRA